MRVDVIDLKSFQKISLNEVRYLNEIDLQKKNALAKDSQLTESAKKQTVKISLAGIIKKSKVLLNDLLYETVPASDTYSPD